VLDIETQPTDELRRDQRRELLARQVKEHPGIVIHVRGLRTRTYEQIYPQDPPAWTTTWQPIQPEVETALYLASTQSCASFPGETRLVLAPSRVCCDIGVSGHPSCNLRLAAYEDLPSSLRETSPNPFHEKASESQAGRLGGRPIR
jgi:hypothetical protein